MNNLIVMVFDNTDEATEVRKSLNDVQKQGKMNLDDAAVVVKDEDGQVHIRHEIDRGVKIGVAGGGFWGLFVGFLFGGPLVSALTWALGGALVGSLADMGIHKDFVREVKETMTPGTSALFVIVRDSDPAVALAALRPYKGEIIQTTLPSEVEESLRKVLEHRT